MRWPWSKKPKKNTDVSYGFVITVEFEGESETMSAVIHGRHPKDWPINTRFGRFFPSTDQDAPNYQCAKTVGLCLRRILKRKYGAF